MPVNGNPRPGWERQLAAERACGQEQRGGDRRKPPERPDRWLGQGNYSGQPVKAPKFLLVSRSFKCAIPGQARNDNCPAPTISTPNLQHSNLFPTFAAHLTERTV